MYEEELEKKATFARQRYYENGSKALKLLAWKLRKQQAESTIFEIRLTFYRQVQNKSLMAEITKEEIGKAISRLKVNKTPGSDGFPAEWYKAFKDQLIPMLFYF